MNRSPIEMLIDSVDVPVAQPTERDVDADAALLLAVADAAKAWRKHGPKSAKHQRVSQRLKEVVDRWIAIGG